MTRYCSFIVLLAWTVSAPLARGEAPSDAPVAPGPVLIPLPPSMEMDPEAPPAPPPPATLPDPAEAAPTEPAPPPLPPPEPARTDAWTLYNQAFSAATAGDDYEAIPLLRRVAKEHPGHPAVPHAWELLRLIEQRLTGASAARPAFPSLGSTSLRPPIRMPPPKTLNEFAQRMRADTPSNNGQVTLVLGQTIAGIALGLEFCFAVGCRDPALGTLSVLGGAGLGLTLSLLLSQKGITVGHALSLGVGGAWGFWNAGATVGLLQTGAFLPDGGGPALPLAFAMGQVVGTVVGEIAYQVLRPGDGDIWAATSTSAWAISVTLLISGAVNPRGGLIMIPETVIAGDLGLMLGGIFAMIHPMGAGRVWVINAGGLLGALGGAIVAALIIPTAIASGNTSNLGSITAASTAGGIILGLGLTTYISRNMDVPNLAAPTFTLMATSTGGVTPGLAFKL